MAATTPMTASAKMTTTKMAASPKMATTMTSYLL
jgi:hypothetical protein